MFDSVNTKPSRGISRIAMLYFLYECNNNKTTKTVEEAGTCKRGILY